MIPTRSDFQGFQGTANATPHFENLPFLTNIFAVFLEVSIRARSSILTKYQVPKLGNSLPYRLKHFLAFLAQKRSL